jgi:hypothetical protein
MPDQTPLSLPFLHVEPFAGLALSREDELEYRWSLLAQLGIDRDDDVTPLVAWRNYVADSNGLDRAQLDPSQGGVLDLWDASTALRKFIWALA